MRSLLILLIVLLVAAESLAESVARAYLVTNSASINRTDVHLINSGVKAQRFRGSLIDKSGKRLGDEGVILHNGDVAPQGRVILTAEDLESVFGVDAWTGPAMLEVQGDHRFEVMTVLTSPSGLRSNTNCVREDAVHNIEGVDSEDVSFIRLINIGKTPIINIRGSLIDRQGRPIGRTHVSLYSELISGEQVWLSQNRLEELIGSDWSGQVSLVLTAPHPNLRLLNLNLTTADTFFNFSCYENEETAAVFLMTNASSVNHSEMHVINSSRQISSLSGQLVNADGSTTPEVILAETLEPGGRTVLTSSLLESIFDVDSWQGPAMVTLKGPDKFDAITRLTSPSGLVSNTNCVRQSAVHMVEGDGNSYVRLINRGDQPVTDIRGTLYDAAGIVLGEPNVLLMASLSPGEQRFINNNELSSLFNVSWIGAASLMVSGSNDENLYLVNLNLVEGSTFFNFSCYENTDRARATSAETFYDEFIAEPIVDVSCINCHKPEGEAATGGLVFETNAEVSHFETMVNYIAITDDGMLASLKDSIHDEQVLSSNNYDDLVGFLRLLNVDVSPDLSSGLIPASVVPGIGGATIGNTGHPSFLSPHVNPIVSAGGFIYVTNTPADTVDVIDPWSRSVVQRINVGIDPVGLAVHPQGNELWVANHISDSVSVIDLDPTSSTYHHVIATVQSLVDETLVTDFDEPTGIAFAASGKAFVALGPANEIAVIENYEVTGRLPIRAQDPRAIAVQGDRLYVLPFESNNQTQLSGCAFARIDGDTCTFNAVEHVFNNNNVLSTHYDADIIINTGLPDRDLFVFDTDTEEQLQVVDGLGTLLYGLAVDNQHRIFVAQTDARNDANGRAGTLKHGLAEMGNRAFFNQVTRVNCQESCDTPVRLDLEPLPPQHPAVGEALATPYAIEWSVDAQKLFVTAAGSNKLFTLNPVTGEILGRVDTGAVPRGIALTDDNEAFVLNAVDNSVTVIDVSETREMQVQRTINLIDPTDPDIKAGRRLFNDAGMSTSGTFSCESCHPDGHTDQLIWVLETPVCDVDGCTQIPPRLTMPVRGARDTGPYHWDGIPGDPFGGNNTASINADVEPNCAENDPEGCIRVLVDGSLATTMCEVGNCELNSQGQAGAFNDAERKLLSKFVLSVPYPPAPERQFDNGLSIGARQGFFNFSFVNNAGGMATGAQTCGDCHKMPFLVSTNTPGTGMDAPTWRGAYDRWMILPQGRLNIIDLLNLAGINDSFRERDIWSLAGSTEENWRMVLEGSTGHSGAFGRQVSLTRQSADSIETSNLLEALEQQAGDEAILLQGEGVFIDGQENRFLALEFSDGAYHHRDESTYYERSQLLNLARNGRLVLTLTGRVGKNVGYDDPQPAIWPQSHIGTQTRNVDLPFLTDELTLTFNARHVTDGASVFVNGKRIEADVRCAGGSLPFCEEELLRVSLAALPETGGLHFLQLKNASGLFSNDMMFFVEQQLAPSRQGNLIESGGTFSNEFNDHWNTVELVTDSISVVSGEVLVAVRRQSVDPWRAQLSHSIMVQEGQTYTICYEAKAEGPRVMTAYVDSNLDDYRNLSGGQFTANLLASSQSYSHTFEATGTDLRARVAFNFAQSALDVTIDNIGVYEGHACGSPDP